MNRTIIKGLIFVVVVFLLTLLSIQVGEGGPSPAYSLTGQELDDLLAPIALYPDPLLAEMLPASTYPTEVADAAAWLRSGGDPSMIDGQNWGESVRAVAHYPTILYMMADNLDWTAELGDAFLNQPEDVTMSIQRLRWQARDVGNLSSTDQESVAIEGDYIQIIPAQPQYIYVPQYDPSVIYVQRWTPGISPFITFGLGLAIGGWLSLDFDWNHRHVIYHGWSRRGWVDNARPYVHITNVYVQRSRPFINQTWRHDPSRGNPERYWASRPSSPSIGRYARTPEVRGRGTTPTGSPAGMFGPAANTHTFSNRGKDSLGAAKLRPTMPTPAVSNRPITAAPSISKQPTTPTPAVSNRPTTAAPSISKQPSTPAPGSSRGFSQPSPARTSVQPARVPSGAFGGYRGTDEVRTQSLRGETSRQSSVGQKSPSPAPTYRGSTPADRTTTPGKKGSSR